jgi:hypothetical protein
MWQHSTHYQQPAVATSASPRHFVFASEYFAGALAHDQFSQ